MKFLHFLLYSAGFMTATCLQAQDIVYPNEVKQIYDDADAAIVLTKQQKPIIGVPAGFGQQAQLRDVEHAGGIGVVIPATEDAATLRDICSKLDGLVLQDGISSDNKFSILLHKAAVDRNIPFLGHNALMEKIDSALWRRHIYINDYTTLISRAQLFKRAHTLHDHIFTLDSHADQPCAYSDGASVGLRKTNQVNIQKMQEGRLDAVYLVNWQGNKPLTAEGQAKAEAFGKKRMQQIHEDVEKYADFCGIARTAEEAYALKKQGKKVFFIGIENGNALGDNLANIETYARQKATYITLTWSGNNKICDSSTPNQDNTPKRGLTAFGKQVVKEMNRCGVIVDCSHASDQTFWDCIKLSTAPIICSHSGARALWNHNRNITDDMLQALAKNGGVIQVYGLWNFQHNNQYEANINTMLDHIDHCVKVAGIDHVGIGMDLDGGGGLIGINGDNDMINLTMGMMERGYTDEQIEKIWGKNFLRVLTEVQNKAKIKL